MSNSCIRVYADPKQIAKCKEELAVVNTDLRQLSNALNAAGNAVRLRILYLLDTEQKMCPCDLSDILEMTVPAISQHLKKLRASGLVKSDKVGQTIFYSIDRRGKDVIVPLIQAIHHQTLSP